MSQKTYRFFYNDIEICEIVGNMDDELKKLVPGRDNFLRVEFVKGVAATTIFDRVEITEGDEING